MKITLPTAAILFALGAGAAHAEFAIAFDWSGLKLCNTGNPNRVGNPAFVVKGLPKGTDNVEFRLTDLNVPSYNHGGGKLLMSADGKPPPGLFKYASPCPPDGVHTYEWMATARQGNKVLARAKAQHNYPE